MDYLKNAYDEWEDNYGKDCLEQLMSDPKFPSKLVVTTEQAMIICEPNDAPENFYCDGEISHDQALANWKRKLKMSGLNPTQVSIVTKYVFG